MTLKFDLLTFIKNGGIKIRVFADEDLAAEREILVNKARKIIVQTDKTIF